MLNIFSVVQRKAVLRNWYFFEDVVVDCDYVCVMKYRYVLIVLSASLSIYLIALDEKVDNSTTTSIPLLFPNPKRWNEGVQHAIVYCSYYWLSSCVILMSIASSMPVARGFYMFFIVGLLRTTSIRDARFPCNSGLVPGEKCVKNSPLYNRAV